MKKQVEQDDRRFPLYWPEGWPRTPEGARRTAAYKIPAGRARDHLLKELTLMKARRVVISTNVAIRPDGLPYANQRSNDPGVAVYWKDPEGVERVIACDKWKTVNDNLRAVGLAIEALRALERTGASEIIARAFRGFAALPASTSRPWRVVLGIDPMKTPTSTELKEAYLAKARAAHPDRGGSHDAIVEINDAYEKGKVEVWKQG